MIDYTYCSGLLSRQTIASIGAVRRLEVGQSLPSGQKPLARVLFASALPEAIWTREGKVNHLGLTYRGARLHRDAINDFVRSGRAALEIAGVSMRRLLPVIDAMTRGIRSADPMSNAAMSIAVWYSKLSRHSFEHPSSDSTIAMVL
jgi:hypothetical protein